MELKNSRLLLNKSTSVLVRKSGLFYRRKISLLNVQKILAINNDAITHDEIRVCFVDDMGKEFFISEFDENFEGVMHAIELIFKGMSSWEKVGEGLPLEHRVLVLWVKREGAS